MSKNRILSALLAVALVLSLSSVISSMSVTALGAGGGSSLKLDAPQNLDWGANYDAEFDFVPESEGEYDFILYRNNQEIYRTSWSGMFDASGRISLSTSRHIDESGTYKFAVSAVAEDHMNNSDFAYSPEAVYTRPSQSLGTPTNLRWEVSDNKFWTVWDPPANAVSTDEYMVDLYRIDENGVTRNVGSTWGRLSGNKCSFDSNYGMSEEGIYYFTVTALSSRLNTIANGVASPSSPKYNLGEVIDNTGNDVGNLLDDVNDGTKTPQEARNELSGMNNAELASSMQANPGVRNNIKDLEDLYNNDMGITVTQSVAGDILDKLDPSKISVVGAGLNTTTPGQQMTLNFTKPNDEAVIDDSQYKNWVQFSIDLDGADDSSNLDVPIQITMPIPTGVSPSRLCILHYHMDGTYETIWPIINGDGTITFTVTRFSLFVFANAVDTSPAVTPPSASGDDNSSGSGSSAAAANETIWMTSGNVSGSSRSPGSYGIRSSAWAKMGNNPYYHDTTEGRNIKIRVYIGDPGNFKKDTLVSGYVDGAGVEKTRNTFNKWFDNKMQFIHFDQQSDWEAPIQVAAKIDLSGMDVKNLCFYSYDRSTNTYRFIENPMYTIDEKGYLHFTTPYAGEIIISDGPLKRI